MKSRNYFLLLLFSISLVSSCKKIKKEPIIEAETVTFKLSGFSSKITPIMRAKIPSRAQLFQSIAPNPKNITPKDVEQLLYFWSFNEVGVGIPGTETGVGSPGTLVPNIALDLAGTEITYISYNNTINYTGGYKYEKYGLIFYAGTAAEFTELEHMTIKIPTTGTSEISKFGFFAYHRDVYKSVELHYSTNSGDSFTLHSEALLTAPSYGEYEIDISTIPNILNNENVQFKLIPIVSSKPASSRKLTLDNIRLIGIYNGEDGSNTPDEDPDAPEFTKLHYYVFNTDDGALSSSGEIDFNPANQSTDISLKLIPGSYSAVFVSNSSDEELLTSSSLTNSQNFYVGNSFDNSKAIIFGKNAEDILVDKNNITNNITLNRLFSQIKFIFTDEDAAGAIDRIVIKRLHDNFWYAPFGPISPAPSSLSSEINFSNPFTTGNNSISFNQFLGEPKTDQALNYELTIYGHSNEVLRTFTVNTAAKNNVQVTFTGELLPEHPRNGNFVVNFNTDWDGEIEEEF